MATSKTAAPQTPALRVQGTDHALDADATIAWDGEVPAVITGQRLRWLAYNGYLVGIRGGKPSKWLEDGRDTSIQDVDEAIRTIQVRHPKRKAAAATVKHLKAARRLLVKAEEKAAKETA